MASLTLVVSPRGFARYTRWRLERIQDELLPEFRRCAHYLHDTADQEIERISWAISCQLRAQKYDFDAVWAMVEGFLAKLRALLAEMETNQTEIDSVLARPDQ